MSIFFNSGQISRVLIFFTWPQILSWLIFNKFSLSFNQEIFQMIRASLDYRGSEIRFISLDNYL